MIIEYNQKYDEEIKDLLMVTNMIYSISMNY